MTQLTLRRPFAVAIFVVVLSGLVVLLSAGTAVANVYATNLKIGGANSGAVNVAGGGSVTFSFILNENADSGVTLTIYRASDNAAIRTVNLGNLARGANSWTWDGRTDGGALVSASTSYYFTVTASDDGHTAWEAISVDANPQNKYYLPTSVEVNSDPNSKYYGRIYVGEGLGSGTATWSGSPRVTTSGFYLMNADCTDAVGQGDTARTAGVPWDFGAALYTATGQYDTSAAPWHACIAPDGRLICANFYDGLSGCYALDPDATTAQTILAPAPWDGTGTRPSGLTDNHGNLTAVWAEGTGADMQLYYLDEDYPAGTFTANVWRLGVGMEPWPVASKPVDFIDHWTVQTRILNTTDQIRRDEEGNWYISQYRSDGTDVPSFIKVSPDGTTVMFNSLTASRAFLGDTGAADLFRGTQCLAVDSQRGRLATATRNAGKIHIVDLSLDLSTRVEFTIGTGINRYCAFDNVGNLYVVNSSAEILRVYSPPDGANSSTTRSYGKIVATSGDLTPPSAPTAVTDDGARQLGTSQIHVTWTAATDAESGIAGYECAVGTTPYDLGSYTKGWTSVGNTTQATITGLNLLPGCTYYVYVRATNGAGLTGDVGTSDGIVVLVSTTVAGAKKLNDGSLVAIQNAVVTKKFSVYADEYFYIESPDRSAGIRCVGSFSPEENHVVTVQGTVKTGDEVYIQLDSVDDLGPAQQAIAPVGMTLKTLGGSAFGKQGAFGGGVGLNNVGLYVKVWGNTEFEVVDDEFLSYMPVNDGSVTDPIWCYSETIDAPSFTYAAISGIVSVKYGKPVILMTDANAP